MKQTGTVLDKILAVKVDEVARLKAIGRSAELRAQAEAAGPGRNFLAALKDHPGRAIIAEIKKASPSAGVFQPARRVDDQARAYQAGGAACLSVLTDRQFFGGSPADLNLARQTVDLPILRKDFIIDPIQIHEAKAAGADAVLLIAAALEPGLLADLHALAGEVGLCPLVEVHEQNELDPVLGLKPDLIGINNRNLKTLQVSLDNFGRLRRLIPASTTVVAESGVTAPADLDRLEAEGAAAFLIGTTLMRSANPTTELIRLRGGEGRS